MRFGSRLWVIAANWAASYKSCISTDPLDVSVGLFDERNPTSFRDLLAGGGSRAISPSPPPSSSASHHPPSCQNQHSPEPEENFESSAASNHPGGHQNNHLNDHLHSQESQGLLIPFHLDNDAPAAASSNFHLPGATAEGRPELCVSDNHESNDFSGLSVEGRRKRKSDQLSAVVAEEFKDFDVNDLSFLLSLFQDSQESQKRRNPFSLDANVDDAAAGALSSSHIEQPGATAENPLDLSGADNLDSRVLSVLSTRGKRKRKINRSSREAEKSKELRPNQALKDLHSFGGTILEPSATNSYIHDDVQETPRVSRDAHSDLDPHLQRLDNETPPSDAYDHSSQPIEGPTKEQNEHADESQMHPEDHNSFDSEIRVHKSLRTDRESPGKPITLIRARPAPPTEPDLPLYPTSQMDLLSRTAETRRFYYASGSAAVRPDLQSAKSERLRQHPSFGLCHDELIKQSYKHFDLLTQVVTYTNNPNVPRHPISLPARRGRGPNIPKPRKAAFKLSIKPLRSQVYKPKGLVFQFSTFTSRQQTAGQLE
ncbi:hypothetical protein PtB15_3B231 [Puccinia triticina]|nr:hypothetical protein PtB15_3B231 [Puccinia triticina]